MATRKSKGYAFRPEQYNPAALANMDERAVRAEYRALQKRAHSRLVGFEAAGLENTQTYRYNREVLVSISKLSKEDVIYALSDAYKFLTADRGTVKGFKAVNRKIVESLSRGGINIPNDPESIELFGQFMTQYRASGGTRASYSSERAAAFFADRLADDVAQDIEQAFQDFMYEELGGF